MVAGSGTRSTMKLSKLNPFPATNTREKGSPAARNVSPRECIPVLKISMLETPVISTLASSDEPKIETFKLVKKTAWSKKISTDSPVQPSSI